MRYRGLQQILLTRKQRKCSRIPESDSGVRLRNKRHLQPKRTKGVNQRYGQPQVATERKVSRHNHYRESSTYAVAKSNWKYMRQPSAISRQVNQSPAQCSRF